MGGVRKAFLVPPIQGGSGNQTSYIAGRMIKNSGCTGSLLVKALDCRYRVPVPLAAEIYFSSGYTQPLVWFPDPSCMGGAREGREGRERGERRVW